MDTERPRHKEGSPKQKVHLLFDEQGQDAAWTLGHKLQLSPSTLRSWFNKWKREAADYQPRVKKVKVEKESTPKEAKEEVTKAPKAEAKDAKPSTKKAANGVTLATEANA